MSPSSSPALCWTGTTSTAGTTCPGNRASPYRVWVSEIMLQQTQVSTVLNYFDRFMQALPTVQALAEAPEDEVLHLWTGLGYYTRARNLQKAAKIVVEQHGGEFPRSVEQLTELPGIGRSTAGASPASAWAFARRSWTVTSSVCWRATPPRPLPSEPKVANQLWATAERFTPLQRANHYTQAMMDMGATLCTRSKPSCLICPLQRGCEAHLHGEETRYPEPKPRKALPQRRTLMPLLANHEGAILLYRRPSSGLWGGLWSLPELDDLAQLDDLAYQHGLRLAGSQAMEGLTHTFSHFQLAIEPCWCTSTWSASTWPRPTGSGITSPPRRAWALPPR